MSLFILAEMFQMLTRPFHRSSPSVTFGASGCRLEIWYSAWKPFLLMVSSERNIMYKASPVETISSGIYETEIKENHLFTLIFGISLEIFVGH